jgi:3-hydroxyacyl-CoA dehydrogenase
VRDLKARHDNADAYFQFARNTVKAMAPQLPGAPADCVEQVEASVQAPTSTTAWPTSARPSSA